MGSSIVDPVLCAAAASAAPGRAQDVGLLLGLSEANTGGSLPARLTTHWITYSGGKASAVRTLNGILAPRADGFWQVALVRRCETEEWDGGERVHCYDSLWTAPLSRAEPQIAHDLMDPCTTEYIDLNFVSPSYISWSSRYWQSDCVQRGWSDVYSSRVQAFDNDTLVQFSKLGPGAGRAYRDAAKRALNHGTAVDAPERQHDRCEADSVAQDGWYIQRDSAQWRAVLFQQQHTELCQLVQPIDWPLPVSVTGYAEPHVDWPAVTELEPNATQAFIAPGGAVLLIVVEEAIHLYALDTSDPGKRLLTLPAGNVVMVQWAIGRTPVARWSRALGR